jgi:hypothetical protein
MARGEVRHVQQGGGGLSPWSGSNSDVFHNVADRWPEAIEVATLARHARAFANGALELASRMPYGVQRLTPR